MDRVVIEEMLDMLDIMEERIMDSMIEDALDTVPSPIRRYLVKGLN